MLTDVIEMRSFLTNSDRTFHLIERNLGKIKEMLCNFKNMNVVFPFNLLCDYILFQIEILELENEKEHLIEQQDKVITY